MSQQYNGQPGNESLHASFNISASTNATPIVITTTAPHDFTEGDAVNIKGHGANVNANGDWQVHVIDGSNVALYASVGSGGLSGGAVGIAIGGATGTIQGTGYLPTVQLFQDLVDDLSASNLNPLAIGNADRTQYALAKVGAFKKVLDGSRAANGLGAGGTTTQYGTGVVLDTTWRRLGLNSNALVIDFFDGGANPYPRIQNNDIVELSFEAANVDTTVAGHAPIYLALAMEQFDEGTSPSVALDGAATSLKIQGSARLYQDSLIQPCSLRAKLKVVASRQQPMTVYVVGRTVTGINAGFRFTDDILWTWRVLRPTGLVV